MRTALVSLVVVLSSLTAGVALASPPGAPTPPNADKVERPQTPAVAKTPTVSYHTAVQAQRHDQVAQSPGKAIPANLRAAKQQVVARDTSVADARLEFRGESQVLAYRAEQTATPVERVTTGGVQGKDWDYRGKDGHLYKYVAPTAGQLAEASETYVSAAQLLVGKSGNLSQRVARENPDEGAKVDAAKAMVEDYKKGAELYRKSADLEDKRAETLTKSGDHVTAQIARDKAHNTRVVADSFDKKAAVIEAKGVPGASAYTLPAELKL